MADEKMPKFMQYNTGDNSKEVINMAKQIHPPRRITDKLL
jgi:hypothetical protein